MILVLATSRGVVTAAAIPPNWQKKIQSISYNYKTNIIYLKQHHKQMIAMGWLAFLVCLPRRISSPPRGEIE
jgi:hypothetical protein